MKNINEKIFKAYFFYHNLLFSAKELYNSSEMVNDEIVKHINDALIELKKDSNRKKNPKNENPNKIHDIVKKSWSMVKDFPLDVARIAHVSKVSDHSNLKILNLKPMLQRLLISFGQVKAGNTSENVLNEIRKIIYSL